MKWLCGATPGWAPTVASLRALILPTAGLKEKTEGPLSCWVRASFPGSYWHKISSITLVRAIAPGENLILAFQINEYSFSPSPGSSSGICHQVLVKMQLTLLCEHCPETVPSQNWLCRWLSLVSSWIIQEASLLTRRGTRGGCREQVQRGSWVYLSLPLCRGSGDACGYIPSPAHLSSTEPSLGSCGFISLSLMNLIKLQIPQGKQQMGRESCLEDAVVEHWAVKPSTDFKLPLWSLWLSLETSMCPMLMALSGKWGHGDSGCEVCVCGTGGRGISVQGGRAGWERLAGPGFFLLTTPGPFEASHKEPSADKSGPHVLQCSSAAGTQDLPTGNMSKGTDQHC